MYSAKIFCQIRLIRPVEVKDHQKLWGFGEKKFWLHIQIFRKWRFKGQIRQIFMIDVSPLQVIKIIRAFYQMFLRAGTRKIRYKQFSAINSCPKKSRCRKR